MASVGELTRESLDRFNSSMDLQPPVNTTRRLSFAQATRKSSVASSYEGDLPMMGRRMSRRESRVSLSMGPTRRFSYAGVGAMASRRFSTAAMSTRSSKTTFPVVVANTYKMTPDEGCKFSPVKVETMLNLVLQQFLENETYRQENVGFLTRRLTENIKDRVKELNFPRYKIVCHVYIGQSGNNSLEVASRCVWDPQNDNFATATFQNGSLFAVATVYGVYFE
ncbi:dynein light chain Tctex-type 5-B-like [Branchiostoma lanceolatum]|uniref:dynein light chain Tctex-type 5-B-like n=1 Tax=Branchiostoma lanceolatum TaxID=7740 RepID=UPI003451565F